MARRSRQDTNIEVLYDQVNRRRNYVPTSASILKNYTNKKSELPGIQDDIRLLTALIQADLKLIDAGGGLISSQDVVISARKLKELALDPDNYSCVEMTLAAIIQGVDELVTRILGQPGIASCISRINKHLQTKTQLENAETRRQQMLLDAVTPAQVLDAFQDLEERIADVITDPKILEAIEIAIKEVGEKHFG